MAQFKNPRNGDVVTVFGPVADAYAARPQWESVEDAPPSLGEMTADQLKEHAETIGADVTGARTKDQLRARISAHLRAHAPKPSDEGDGKADSES